jgi:serine/threonine protein kinase
MENKEKKPKNFIKKKNFAIVEFILIFREIRSLLTVYKKSEYLIQKSDINLDEEKKEVIFNFSDEGIDLYSLIISKEYDYKSEKGLIQWIMFQILKGLETLNSLNIIHRDINPRHILISSTGKIKITGFSLSINDIESKFVYDKIVGTLCYIAPEVLLMQNYNSKIDIWAAGVIMLELYMKKAFTLKYNEDDTNEDYSKRFFKQLKFIANKLKVSFNFNENNYNKEDLINWLNKDAKFIQDEFDNFCNNISGLEEEGKKLLQRLLTFNPKERISAKEALKMDYFKDYQYLNKDEFKKKKDKGSNENMTNFLKNLEKEYQRVNDKYPNEKQKKEKFQEELYTILAHKQ